MTTIEPEPEHAPSELQCCLASESGAVGERHTCIHTYVRTYMHACIRACIHTYMRHTCIHTYIHTCIHAYIHACMHACIHTYQLAAASSGRRLRPAGMYPLRPGRTRLTLFRSSTRYSTRPFPSVRTAGRESERRRETEGEGDAVNAERGGERERKRERERDTAASSQSAVRVKNVDKLAFTHGGHARQKMVRLSVKPSPDDPQHATLSEA